MVGFSYATALLLTGNHVSLDMVACPQALSYMHLGVDLVMHDKPRDSDKMTQWCVGATAQRGRRRKGRSQAQPCEVEDSGERHAKRASLGEQQEEAAADEQVAEEQPAPAVEKTGKRRRLARMQA